MSNWCDCDLVVTGNEVDMTAFRNMAVEQSPVDGKSPDILSAESFIPYPAEYRKKDERCTEWWKKNTVDGRRYGTYKPGVNPMDAPNDDFNSGGYDWCRKNWGTKWGICDPEVIEEASEGVVYKFACAWSPCIPVIEAMGKKFPSLQFALNYYEGGMGFQGEFIVAEGKVVQNTSDDNYHGPRGG